MERILDLQKLNDALDSDAEAVARSTQSDSACSTLSLSSCSIGTEFVAI